MLCEMDGQMDRRTDKQIVKYIYNISMCRYGYIYNIEFFNLIEPLNTLDTLTIEYNTRKEKKIHTNFAKTKN